MPTNPVISIVDDDLSVRRAGGRLLPGQPLNETELLASIHAIRKPLRV
jgi:FixJ family two-component response regulator